MPTITVPVQKPVVFSPASANGPSPIFLPNTSPNNDADVVILSGNGIAPAAANQAGSIVGIAQCSSKAVFQGQAFPTSSPSYDIENVFGYSQVGSGLFPPGSGQVPVLTLGPPTECIFNLTAITGWQTGGTYQATYGTGVGLAIDGTTGYYILDPHASNIVAIIQDVDMSVNLALLSNQYVVSPVGVLGMRVKVVFLASVLAITQGD